MSAAHEEQTLASAYVLGALDPAERQAFEAHVAGCATCRDEVHSLQRVADALSRIDTPKSPVKIDFM